MKSVHEFAGLYTTTLLVDRSSWFFKALIMGHTVVHSALKSLKVHFFKVTSKVSNISLEQIVPEGLKEC